MAKSQRGFASMTPEKQKEIASKGGRAAHAKGTAHEFSSEEARNAGRKGGQAVSRNREHMSSIGRKGGESVSRNREHMAEIGREGGHTDQMVASSMADTEARAAETPTTDTKRNHTTRHVNTHHTEQANQHAD